MFITDELTIPIPTQLVVLNLSFDRVPGGYLITFS